MINQQQNQVNQNKKVNSSPICPMCKQKRTFDWMRLCILCDGKLKELWKKSKVS